MKNHKALLALFAAGMFHDLNVMNLERKPRLTPKPPEKAPIPKGCKEFTLDGITVVALSEKRALKKISKLKSK